MSSTPLSSATPNVSRRTVLGALGAILWPSRLLLGQEAGVRMIPVEGEGAKYWSRWRGPSGQGLVSSGS
jgi:hypothetical protein